MKGAILWLAGKEPDEIILARIEGEMKEAEVNATKALEELGGLIAGYKRESLSLKPKVEKLEKDISTLLNAGKEAEAGELAQEFEITEADYIEKTRLWNETTEELRVRMRESEIEIEKAQKQLHKIKSDKKRADINDHLNALRKATSTRRFDTSGLQDDILKVSERNQSRLDKSEGTKMVLDLGLEKKKRELEITETVRQASQAESLARFAAKRNISVGQATDKTESAPSIGDKPKTKA